MRSSKKVCKRRAGPRAITFDLNSVTQTRAPNKSALRPRNWSRVDDITLVIKATKDGQLEIAARCFEETVKILEGERLEVSDHYGQVCFLRRRA